MWCKWLCPVVLLLICIGGSNGQKDDSPGGSASGEEPECKVGEWSGWSPCVRSPSCPRNKGKPMGRQHQMQATRGFDKGRKSMMALQKIKHKLWDSCYLSWPPCSNKYYRNTIRGYIPCQHGLSDIYLCRNVGLLSYLNMKDLTGGVKVKGRWSEIDGNDIWGWTDPKTGDEYAIIGLTHGTSFVRITDPINPIVLGFLHTRTYPSLWRDVKVVNDFAFIGAESWNHGMQIFKLSRLRDMREFSVLKSDLDYLGLGNTHNVIGNNETGFIYLVGDKQGSFEDRCRGGLHMINVKNPMKPKFEGCYDDDGYTHDAQCVIYRGPDDLYRGHEICFNYNEDSLTIVDVSRKARPAIVSKMSYDDAQYTHQGWLTPDHKYILLNDEYDEYKANDPSKEHTRTMIWDVTKLMQPKLVLDFWSHVKAIDHNLYTVGNLTYMTNYKAGLRIVHFDEQKMALKEVGYFDVYPSEDSATFGGSWSNYPYYKSGVVAVSSIEYGLYILKPDAEAIQKAVASTKAFGEIMRSRKTEPTGHGDLCPHPTETRECTPKDC